jgi:hypothetical protein
MSETVKGIYCCKINLQLWWLWESRDKARTKKESQPRKHPSISLRAGERRHEKKKVFV